MDVLIYQTPDDGDIKVQDGVTQLTPGFESAVYLSMFGGNEDDDGSAGNQLSWWGNQLDADEARHYRGETETTLESIPAVPVNLLKVEEAVKRDLKWLTETRAASSVTVSTSMPAVDTVSIVVFVVADGVESQFEYVENWKASR